MRIIQSNAARQQEHPLLALDFAAIFQQIDAEKHGKEQLVLLEQRSAHVAVERVGEIVAQILQPIFEHVRLLRIVDRVHEQVDVPRKRVLVHGLDVGEIGDGEKEHGRVDSDRSIAHSRFVDFALRLLGDGLLFRNFVC